MCWWWCGWLWMQGCWMQNRTVQSLASLELACPPSVTPVVMQLQSEEGRNISLKCRVTGQYSSLSLYHHYHHTIIVTNTITSQHQVHHYKPDMPVNTNRNVSVLVAQGHMKNLPILPNSRRAIFAKLVGHCGVLPKMWFCQILYRI